MTNKCFLNPESESDKYAYLQADTIFGRLVWVGGGGGVTAHPP